MVDYSVTLLLYSIILQDPTLHRSVKLVILSTLGDIAIAIGTEFKMYLVAVVEILNQASSLQVDKVDYAAVSCDVL